MSLSSAKESLKVTVGKLNALYNNNISSKDKCMKENKAISLLQKKGEVFGVGDNKDRAFTALFIEVFNKAEKFKKDILKNASNGGVLPDDEAMYIQLNEDIKGLPEQLNEFIEKFKLYKYKNYSANLMIIKLFDLLSGFKFNWL